MQAYLNSDIMLIRYVSLSQERLKWKGASSFLRPAMTNFVYVHRRSVNCANTHVPNEIVHVGGISNVELCLMSNVE